MITTKSLGTTILACQMLVALPSFAASAPFVASSEETHVIESKFVDQTFEIHVQVPVRRADDTERFPVMYLTDCTGGLLFDEMTGIMQMGGDVPRFISVGIGYPGEHGMGGMKLRNRDLTPTEFDTPETSMPMPIAGIPEVTSGKRSGGAPEFLRFIREELQPFIDEKYPTVPGDRAYFGDSLGGLFGLYVLFNQPDTFNRYIIGSPSVWWDNEVILRQAEKFIAANTSLPARLFMAVGALEEVGPTSAPYRMVTNVYRLEAMLRAAKLEGLELSTYTFPDESHTSVISMNYTRGIKAVYGTPEIPFLQAYAIEQMKAAEPSEP